MILGVDTSSKVGSVALVNAGQVVDEITSDSPSSFSRLLLEMVEKILSRNSLALSNLSCVAVATGPGSFTGIRIGLATVEGMALATGMPVLGVSTLEAMARLCNPARPVSPVIDAGNGKVYYATFRALGDSLEKLSGEAMARVEEVVASHTGTPFCGEGAQKYSAQLGNTAEVISFNGTIAAGVALRAWEKMRDGHGGVGPLKPNYIQKSAAEKSINL